MGGLYSHTTRSAGTTLTANIYSSDHQTHIDNHLPDQMDDYSSTVAQMQATTDPGEVGNESQATSLAGELERIRNILAEFGGGAQWYVTPPANLTDITFTSIQGLNTSNNGTDANNDIDIAVGQCWNEDFTSFMKLSSALTKQLDAAWAVGSNAGGLDTGAKAATTWYAVWLIKRS